VRRAGFGAVAAAGMLLSACTDLDIKPLPSVGSDASDPAIVNPSFAGDIQPIFMARCAVAGCHITPTEANLGLVLKDAPTSYAHLVSVPSLEFPGVNRVEPEDSAASYLMFKLDAGEIPKSGPVLSQGTRDTIRYWIDPGAPAN